MRDNQLTTHVLICARAAPAISAEAPTARIITVLGDMVAMPYRPVAPGVVTMSHSRPLTSTVLTLARSDNFLSLPTPAFFGQSLFLNDDTTKEMNQKGG